MFGVALAVTFGAWYASEKTLSIHSIHTTRREALLARDPVHLCVGHGSGRSASAETFNLGYLVSALLFGTLIALVAVAHLRFRLNAMLAFWIAYILTRPLGASLGDFLSQPTENGGLEFGPVVTSAIFLLGHPRHRHLSVDHQARCWPRILNSSGKWWRTCTVTDIWTRTIRHPGGDDREGQNDA